MTDIQSLKRTPDGTDKGPTMTSFASLSCASLSLCHSSLIFFFFRGTSVCSYQNYCFLCYPNMKFSAGTLFKRERERERKMESGVDVFQQRGKSRKKRLTLSGAWNLLSRIWDLMSLLTSFFSSFLSSNFFLSPLVISPPPWLPCCMYRLFVCFALVCCHRQHSCRRGQKDHQDSPRQAAE
jgi:hypothetical protein